jgi:UPF0755 protein
MSGEDYEGWQDSPRGRREPAGYEAEAGYDAESGYSSEPGFEPTVDYNLPRHGRRHAADQYASDQDWDTGAAGYQAQDPYAAPQDPYAAPQPGYRDRDRTGEQDPYGRTDPHGNAGYYPPEPYDSRGDYGGQPSPHADNGYQQNGYGQGEFAQGNLAPGYDNRDSYPSQAGYQGQDPYDGRGFYNGQAGGGEPEAFGGQDPYAGYAGNDGYGSDGYGRGPGGQAGYGQPYDSYGAASGSGPMPAYTGGDEYSPASASQQGWQTQDEDYGRRERRESAYQQEDVGHEGPRGGSRRSGRSMDADEDRHSGFFAGYASNDDDHYGRGGGGGGGGRPRRKRGRAAGWIALIIVVAVVCSGAGVVYHYYSEYKSRHASYSGSGFGSVKVVVPQGASADLIGPELVRLGVIESQDPWASYVANKPATLQPGEYKLHEHMSPGAAWAMLNDSKNRVNSTVTIPDGWRYSRILPALAKESGIPLSQFQTAIKDTSALGLPSWAHGNPEGFLYPDTYDIVPGTTTALQILQKAVSQFNAEMKSIGLASGARRADFTENQVITEASLLEAEVGPKYYADVARALDNRLHIGMPLQLDSTIAYITGDYSYNLSTSQLHTPSPYNTFLHSDLPPGPIDQPDAAAIDAVLHPASPSNTYIYFITVNKKGLTDFTDSASQFTAWQTLAKQNGV